MTGLFLLEYPTQYLCIGLMIGRYFPSIDAQTQGVLVTEDGYSFPCKVEGSASRFLEQHPELLSESHIWGVWPRTLKESPGLFLTLKSIRPQNNTTQEQEQIVLVDCFCIRGIVVFQNNKLEKLAIRIQRNLKPPKGHQKEKRWQPFTVIVDGFLPEKALGQFWELNCRREGERLVVDDAKFIQEMGLPPKNPKATAIEAQSSQKQPQETADRATLLPSEGSLVPTSSAPSSESQPEQLLQPEEEDMAIPGKLEIVIKISEFPADVKTVENNWKQFEIDCEGKVVSVTVKPKVFKKLEDAKANYPMWVAAIAGKMGAATEKGFVLNEPSIQTFEKKPKEPKPAESGVG